MIYAIIVYENKGKAKRERGTIMQYKWVKRIIVAVVFTFMAGTMSIPAHAEAETNTAGSTMGKETTAEDGIATYANVQEGWKQDSRVGGINTAMGHIRSQPGVRLRENGTISTVTAIG